jgi:ketosteroid isomerase-like protein
MATAARKKTTAKKAAKKGAVHAKTTAKKAVKRAAPAAKKKAAAKAPARRFTPAEELANRILAAMDDERNIDLGKFYTEDAVSVEPAGGTLVGLQQLRSKLAGWLAGLRSSSWKARHIFVSKNAVCIEWEADLVMKDGRQVKLNEVAVHELRGEKICRERYYYDPRALMPPQQVAPPVPRAPVARPAERSEDGEPGIDPMDL